MNGRSPTRHEADIVIVGAGAAGAMAALAAQEQGARFVGIDQLPEFGGTAIVSGGGMQVAGSRMQAEKGVDDSPDRAYHDLIDGNAEADPAWARFYYDHANQELFEWLCGHELEYASISINEGDSVPRRHVPKGGGLGLMTRLRQIHQEFGLLQNWHFQMTAKDLLWSDAGSSTSNGGLGGKAPQEINLSPAPRTQGVWGANDPLTSMRGQGEGSSPRVIGVLAEDQNGNQHHFIGHCVIAATGGMAGSLPMVLKYSKKLAAAGKVLAGGGVGALGTGHELLLKHGATLTNVENFVIYVFATPDYEDPTVERGLVVRGIESCIWVNGAGQRFHNEALSGSVYGPPAVLAQTPPIYWAVVDHAMAAKIQVSDPRYRQGLDDLRNRVWQLLEQSPYIAKGETIAELAQNAGINPRGLEATIKDWNTLVVRAGGLGSDSPSSSRSPRGSRGETPRVDLSTPPSPRTGRGQGEGPRDPQTGRPLQGLAPLTEPPFYALQFWPLARKNQGGVRTDLQCRVLDGGGQVIPGLYAAGELCGFAGGHISGTRSLEGIMIGGSLFSGRVAGAWAAYETGAREPLHLKAK